MFTEHREYYIHKSNDNDFSVNISIFFIKLSPWIVKKRNKRNEYPWTLNVRYVQRKIMKRTVKNNMLYMTKGNYNNAINDFAGYPSERIICAY